MKLAAHQPQYLPWLGFFDKMDRADHFVLLDTVQYKKNEWQNRNRIRIREGWQWLTVPVRYHHPMTIREVRIDATSPWRRKHIEALRTHYGRARQPRLYDGLEELLHQPIDDLATLNSRGVGLLAGLLGVRTPMTTASALDDLPEGADQRLIALCRRFGCATYIAGAGGQSYMDPAAWQEAGITVEFQDFHHPVYPQTHAGFEPNLSAVDLLFNHGAGAIGMLRAARREAA